MSLDEPSEQLLARIAALEEKPLHAMTIVEARGFPARMAQAVVQSPAVPPEMASVLDHRIARGTESIGVRLLIPARPVQGVVVYYHGGGWVLGGVAQTEPLGRSLAEAAGCAVALVDYRLAPEHSFPAAVEDAWAALTWIHDQAGALLGRPVPLIVAGDSAGGNLAAVMTQRALAAAGPDIALQILVYPATDADLTRDSYLRHENQLLIGRDTMAWFWNHYAPRSEDRAHTDASPLRASTLKGLPPAIVVTAGHDPLRDEALDYMRRLTDEGVPVIARHFADQMHGFFTLLDVLPASREALGFVADALTRFLTSN